MERIVAVSRAMVMQCNHDYDFFCPSNSYAASHLGGASLGGPNDDEIVAVDNDHGSRHCGWHCTAEDVDRVVDGEAY